MTISSALSIKPGPSSLLAVAAPATGDGAAFAALIGGGSAKTMPALLPADMAATGGQAGAVIGNSLPLTAADTNPDILVVQPVAVAVAVVEAGSALPVVPPTALDIPVDPNGPPSAAPTGDQPQATDDAASLRARSARFRFVNIATIPAVADPPTVKPADRATAFPDTSPPVAPGRDAEAPASASGDVLPQSEAVPDIPVAHAATATAPSATDRPPVRDDAADDIGPGAGSGAAVPTMPMAPAIPVAQGTPPTAVPEGDRSGGLGDPTIGPDDAIASATAPLAMPRVAPDIPVAEQTPATVAPVGDRTRPSDGPADARGVATRIRAARALTALGARDPATPAMAPTDAAPRAVSASGNPLASVAPERDATPSAPTAEPSPSAAMEIAAATAAPAQPQPVGAGASSSPHERSADAVAAPLAAAPPTISLMLAANAPTPLGADPAAIVAATLDPPLAATTTPSRPDDVTAIMSPDRAVAQGRQASPEPVGRAPLAAGAAPLASIPSMTVPPSQAPIAAGAVAPAGELFAAAMHAAGRLNADAPGDAAAVLAAPAVATVAATVATGADTDRSLDLGHPGWPGAMIEHIERLRDAADAVDTRIRLVPDALGGIDVSLRRHDDGVRVTMTADQPATQAILVEARPQLHAMAEARGIRLSETATGGSSAGPAGGLANGAGGDPSTGNGRPRPAAFTPAAPPRASATDTPDPADGRVA